RGLPPVLLAVGPLGVLSARPQEPVPRTRPGAGLGERPSGEGDGLHRVRPLHRESQDLARWLEALLHARTENGGHLHSPPGNDGREKGDPMTAAIGRGRVEMTERGAEPWLRP